MNALAAELEKHPFLAGLATAHLERLSGCARAVSFPQDSFILREGGEAETLYLLVSGRVALEIHVPSRGPIQVESLALHWLFPPRRWVLDARAAEPVLAIAIDAACLRELIDEDPALGCAVTNRLLRQLYSRLERVRLQRLDVYQVTP